jgi:hypothetical protein
MPDRVQQQLLWEKAVKLFLKFVTLTQKGTWRFEPFVNSAGFVFKCGDSESR